MHDTTPLSYSLPSRPASSLPAKPAAASSHPVMFWWHVSQVLWRLMQDIAWTRLTADDARRLDGMLEMLEGVIHLTRSEGKKMSTTEKAAKRQPFPAV